MKVIFFHSKVPIRLNLKNGKVLKLMNGVRNIIEDSDFDLILKDQFLRKRLHSKCMELVPNDVNKSILNREIKKSLEGLKYDQKNIEIINEEGIEQIVIEKNGENNLDFNDRIEKIKKVKK